MPESFSLSPEVLSNSKNKSVAALRENDWVFNELLEGGIFLGDKFEGDITWNEEKIVFAQTEMNNEKITEIGNSLYYKLNFFKDISQSIHLIKLINALYYFFVGALYAAFKVDIEGKKGIYEINDHMEVDIQQKKKGEKERDLFLKVVLNIEEIKVKLDKNAVEEIRTMTLTDDEEEQEEIELKGNIEANFKVKLREDHQIEGLEYEGGSADKALLNLYLGNKNYYYYKDKPSEEHFRLIAMPQPQIVPKLTPSHHSSHARNSRKEIAAAATLILVGVAVITLASILTSGIALILLCIASVGMIAGGGFVSRRECKAKINGAVVSLFGKKSNPKTSTHESKIDDYIRRFESLPVASRWVSV